MDHEEKRKNANIEDEWEKRQLGTADSEDSC